MAKSGRIGEGKLDEGYRLGQVERDRAAEAQAERGDALGGVVLRGGESVAGSPSPRRLDMQLPAVLARVERGPFVGRAAPLQRVRALWEEAARDRGGLVVVAGEPGIGKTRLAARVAVAAHAEGGVVLYGRADEESVLPYQPFVEALRHYAAHRPGLIDETGLPAAAAEELASLVPELGPCAAPPMARGREQRVRSRHELFDAVVRLLLHAAESPRLLLVLEDLHWADVPTLLLLRQLLRRGAGSRLLVIVTYRDLEADAAGPLARVLAELRREAGMETIRLGGLLPSETAELVVAHRGGASVDSALAQRLFDQTGGNPFFIEELLHSPAAASAAPMAVPEGVKDVIGRRLDRLPPASLETLTLAAVLGSDFRLATLQVVVADQPQDDVIASLEAAVAARLILEDSEEVDRFSFTHALVRQTLYERPIASRRLRLHRRVAVALEAALEVTPLRVHPAELAHHYFQAREVGGAAKAVVYSLQAADASRAAHADEDAVAHYERALAALQLVSPDDAGARCDVLLALGAARWRASEPDPRSPFVEALELARRLASPERLARAALGAGGRFYAPGSTDEAYIELLEEALAALEPGDSVLRVRLLARLAEKLVFAQPPERAGELAADAVGMARRLGEAGALAAALMGRHAALLHAEHTRERRRVGEHGLALAGELGARELGALARHWLLYDLAEIGDLDEAQHRLAELDELAHLLQQPLYRHSSLAWRCVLAGLSGRFQEAERMARDSLRLAEYAQAPDAKRHFTAQLVAPRREQGRLDELLPEIERLADEPPVAAWRSLLPLAHLDAGDRTQAQLAYERALGDGAPRTMLWLTAMASLAEAAARLDDPDGASQLYAQLEPYADRLAQWSFTGSAGSVHRLLGRTAAVAGWDDRARVHFEAALRRHAELGTAPLLARTRCDYGELLLRGNRAEHAVARRYLREAGLAARRLGMAGVAERADNH